MGDLAATDLASEDDAELESWAYCKPFGHAFWASIAHKAASTAFESDDRILLTDIFNPRFSDRREEGDQFVPPKAKSEYLQHLRNLVDEEHNLRRLREQQFFSPAFDAERP